MLTCDRAVELLPWLVNRTLSADDRAELERHLEGCEACRGELDATRVMVGYAGEHLPEEWLVSYVEERGLSDDDRALTDKHIEACASCRDTVALLRAGRAGATESASPRIAAAKLTWSDAFDWRTLAMAASLAIVTGAAGWLWVQQGRVAEQARTLEADNERLRGAEQRLADAQAQSSRDIARLEGEIARLNAPHLNAPVFELLPSALVERGGRGGANAIVLKPDTAVVTLMLTPYPPQPPGPVAIEIVNASRNVIWRGRGLEPQRTGSYTITIPTALLPTGECQVILTREGSKQPVLVYSMRVER